MQTDVDLILSKYDYDPETGRITRKSDGSRADTLNPSNGYRRVCLNREFGHRLAHRVAFVLMIGRWPREGLHVHHVNSDREDNRWVNLKEVTPRENNAMKVQREDSNIREMGELYQVSGCTTVSTLEQARALRDGWQKLVAQVTSSDATEER